jgi:NAD-dependent dihydropyrimidine dehydrogenase PreA subunit
MGNNSRLEKIKHILYCKCGGERMEKEIMALVDHHLKQAPVKVTQFSDLCGLVAKSKDQLSGFIEAGTDYMVMGCYKRTLDLLFDQIGEGLPDYQHVNLLEESAEEAITKIDGFCNYSSGTPVFREIKEDSGWPSWYPVIDYNRCTACGQCASFCLFGVYENNGTNIQVVNPEACKNNCPACARICPSTAIIFPKYKNGGAIGGSEDIDEQAEQQRMAKDMDDLLGNDIYAALERRKAKRQSLIREESMKKAYDERTSALKEK